MNLLRNCSALRLLKASKMQKIYRTFSGGMKLDASDMEDITSSKFSEMKVHDNNKGMEDMLDPKVTQDQIKSEITESKRTELEIDKMDGLEREIGLPYKLHGVQRMPKDRAYYVFDRILIQNQIPHQYYSDYMEKIFYGTVYAIAEQDYEFLEEYLEHNFYKKVRASVEDLLEKGYQLKVIEDVVGKTYIFKGFNKKQVIMESRFKPVNTSLMLLL